MLKYQSIVLPKISNQQLGDILQKAHLVSARQIEEALKEQSQEKESKLSEILVKKGWLKQQTADFFLQQWPKLVQQATQFQKQPLGYYLQAAALLDEEQILSILSEQRKGRLWVRLGAKAVLKGWLSQSTIDFFLEHLYPEYAEDSPFIKKDRRQKAEGRGQKDS